MQKQLQCWSILLIMTHASPTFKKDLRCLSLGIPYVQAHLNGVIEETSPTNALQGRIICHQLEIHLR